jgi:hypothetical protein
VPTRRRSTRGSASGTDEDLVLVCDTNRNEKTSCRTTRRRVIASRTRSFSPFRFFIALENENALRSTRRTDAFPTRKPVSCPFIAGTQPPSGFDGRGTRGGGGEPRSSRDIPRVRGARRPAASEGALVRRTRAKTRVNASGERFAMQCFERKMSRIVAPRREPRVGMCVSFRRVVVKIVHHWLVLRHPQ